MMVAWGMLLQNLSQWCWMFHMKQIKTYRRSISKWNENCCHRNSIKYSNSLDGLPFGLSYLTCVLHMPYANSTHLQTIFAGWENPNLISISMKYIFARTNIICISMLVLQISICNSSECMLGFQSDWQIEWVLLKWWTHQYDWNILLELNIQA